MNKGKVGAPFEYSHTYIQFLAFLKIGFKISYRTVQGIVRGLSDYIRIEEIHFTQIRRRIVKIKPSVGNLNLYNCIISLSVRMPTSFSFSIATKLPIRLLAIIVAASAKVISDSTAIALVTAAITDIAIRFCTICCNKLL
jgi:hypothetical protein